MNGKDPTRRMTILMLPDDLVLNCLARLSRLYHPTLSLVSKRFLSLVASTELYQTRTLLGRTESNLHVCLWLCRTDSNPLCWFTLRWRSEKCFTIRTMMVLVPISSPDFPSPRGSEVAVVGPHIYVIGGLLTRGGLHASSSVMVMNCGSHIWRKAPSMRLARVSHSACVLDGKIHVTGGCMNLDSTNWMEAFDTNVKNRFAPEIP
ncbi:unnamed protein product [Microthlaspi erraticum]|uniref:F-box domain-containing protein n=1 Tax=Microthlaspi erraticum TaxID=1685480 RepID=A0A6D2J014_9BRAS|nr:unnamed protein product [Microthlaspi erraticum]